MIKFLLLILAVAAASLTSATPEWQFPLSHEDAILQKELQWAEQAMVNYQQKFGNLPLRSSIRAMHVHTNDWRQDSINVLSNNNGNSDPQPGPSARNGNLRGSS
jgi:hypothetical protein